MTRVLSVLRSTMRSARVLRACTALAVAIVAWACADKVTGLTPVTPKGQIGVYADVAPAGITTLVIQVSGPGIVKPDGDPDTLAFNIPLSNGVAAGSVDVPAGPDRVITARAFIGIAETHRGSVTTDIVAGTNPTLHITMVPLVGSIPLTVSIGSTIVVVRPLLASVAVNDTLRLTSEIRDHNGTLVSAKVRWATLNPNKASVDTNGLVTVRDTGDVQIVGTYGTVGGSSKISGVAVTSVAANHLTWNGSVNTNWSEPNNWTPHGLGAARVPALTDSVVIPAAAPRMPRLDTCVDDHAVRDILIEENATLTTSCYNLNVYGSAVVRGAITMPVHLRPNATAAGKFQNIYVYGAGVTLADSVSANYVEVRIPIGTFALNGHKLTANDLYVPDGTITMVAGDTLIVNGTINWAGDDQTGLLSGGVVLFRGTTFSGSRYYATGTNRVVLDRTVAGTQQVSGFDYVNSPANAQLRRLEIRNRDGVDMCGYIRVTDSLLFTSTGTPATMTSCSSYRIRADGPVITSTNTDVANHQWELMHATGTSLVAGTWHPTYTDFDVPAAVVKPSLSYVNMRFFASNSLSDNLVSTGLLWIEGAGVEFALNGHTATFSQSLTVRTGGVLKMTNAADSLIIGEYVEFGTDQHGLQKTNLTAGVLSVGAYMDGFGFAAQGTFKVVLAGTSASAQKYITRVNYNSRPTQAFYDLEVASGATYGLCENIRVTHNVVVKTGGTLQEWCGSSNVLNVIGDLIGETGSTIKPYQIVLSNATGTANVAGAYNAVYSDFSAADAPVKAGLSYQNLRFFAPNHLLGATTATGHLLIDGAASDLNISGQTLSVGDYMQLQNGGTLTMTDANDVVNVAYHATFNWDGSAVEVSKLTAGVLRVGAYFDGFGFAASGTHTVELTGTHATTQKYITRVNYSTRPAQAFQNLVVTATGTYGLCEFVAVKGTMTVQTGGTLNQWCTSSNHLRVDNDLVVATGATFSIYEAVLNNTVGTQNVVGTFTPVYTSITNSAAANQLKPGLGYTNVQFFTAASLGSNMTVTGDLNINGAGAILTLNGKKLVVTNNLNLQTNGTIVMNNAADSLDVSGAANWNGGGSQAGKLTAGTTIFRGDTFCATNYETSGTHTTVFQRAGTPVRLQCVNSNGVNQPMWNVEVRGAGVSLECHMNVTNDIHVFTGAILNETCGSGTLWVGHTLTTDAGSSVTNGPSYPSTTKLAVVFEDPSGTQNVGGAYSADQSYFTALNAYIQPTLLSNSIDYKYVRIDQSTQFVDSTEIDGNFDIINTAIVSLNDNPVVVKGGMSLATSARLKMVNAGDVLTVALGDPAAALIWNGADNATDGSGGLLLTNGTIFFHGDNFQGTRYHANPGTPHKFVFAGISTSGSVSLNGNPIFANLQLSNSRPVSNSGTTTIQDQLTIDASRTIQGTGTITIGGAFVTAAGSDFGLTSPGTVNVNGPNGTSAVLGGFHPAQTVFGSAAPIATALKAGLGYNAVFISGPYQLNGPTTFANGATINGGGALTMNGQTLNVTGNMDLNGGGVLSMTGSTDVLNVTGFLQFQGSAGLSTLSGGTMTVGGGFINSRTGLHATGTNTLVLNNLSAETVSTSSGAQQLRNLVVSGLGSVFFNGGATVTGNFTVSSATTVSANGTLDIDGTLTTAVGSVFNPSNLDVSATGGTNGIGGSMSISGTTTFSGGTQTIKVAAGVISYNSMNVSSVATVSGGALTLPSGSTLTVNSGGTLDVPAASTFGTVNVSGTLNFLSTASGTGRMTVLNGGFAKAVTDLTATNFVDFNQIYINPGGTLDNSISRSAGAGGFRVKTTITNFSNSGTLTGPAPAILP